MPIKSTFLAGKKVYCRLNFDGFQSGTREVSHRMARSMESQGVSPVSIAAAVVPVIKHLAEVGNIPPQLLQVIPAEVRGLADKVRGVFFPIWAAAVAWSWEKWGGTVRLFGKQLPEILLPLPQAANGLKHALHCPVNLAAHKAAVQRLVRCLGLLFGG